MPPQVVSSVWRWPGRKKQTTTPIHIEHYSSCSQLKKKEIFWCKIVYFDDASLRFHEIFHCFMVLCFDFEDVNSFFMGISRRAYYYMHQFFQARFYCFESLRVLGRRVNDVAKTQKNWNIFSTSREYCILLICLTSWLHFLNKASTNTKERSTWDIWTFFALPIQSCSSGLANTTFANYNSISNYQKANQRPC